MADRHAVFLFCKIKKFSILTKLKHFIKNSKTIGLYNEPINQEKGAQLKCLNLQKLTKKLQRR